MNKYPLDEKGIESIVLDIRQNDLYQKETILKLYTFLTTAMAYFPEETNPEWCEEVGNLLDSIHKRGIAFENLRFDQSNGHRTDLTYPDEDLSVPTSTQEIQFGDIKLDPTKIVSSENHDTQMTEEELAAHFNTPAPRPKTIYQKTICKATKLPDSNSTLEEIGEWESKQNNSNDIYKISARVKNIARSGGGSLTDVGDMLCNTYTHVAKAFYDFAESIPDKETKTKLIDLIRKNEDMPGNFIAATHSGVNLKKKK